MSFSGCADELPLGMDEQSTVAGLSSCPPALPCLATAAAFASAGAARQGLKRLFLTLSNLSTETQQLLCRALTRH